MKYCHPLPLLCLVSLIVVGCGGPKSGRGFTLPSGDSSVGKQVFVDMKCAACHSVTGVERPERIEGEPPEVTVPIGGQVSRIKTYGELVTSIINPSHRLASGHPPDKVAQDGKSTMKNYNEVLTVQQLIDLVAFLQSKYELIPYEPTDYVP